MAEVFVNPYSSSPQQWHAQGASIGWGVDNADATPVSGIFSCLDAVSIQYNRQITTRYPLGGYSRINLIGAPNGTLTLQTLLGPTVVMTEFFEAAGTACKPLTFIIKPFALTKDYCPDVTDAAKNTTFKLTGCIMNQVGFTLQTDQTGMSLCQVPLSFQFTGLDYSVN